MPLRHKRDGPRPPAHREYYSTPLPPARQRTAAAIARCTLSAMRTAVDTGSFGAAALPSAAVACERPPTLGEVIARRSVATTCCSRNREPGDVRHAGSGARQQRGRVTQIARYLLHAPRRNAPRRMRHDVYVRVGQSRLRGACGAVRCGASHVVPSALTSIAICAGRANNESKSARDSE